ncbi:hypothetical protein ASD64_06465 [Mesorhizobium sp. Root157]|uniref:DUF982 domain-containing protein n=1 Tax=Mesorhizobium sp. Root157 TaxID=1736477 RepID=UPI0006F338ED|nr:DUF982 domain-containing protein [Mesorhizobium sp. Root157]KQZ87087.1 hypothetical protein ASD64_06465 [Mesorhizobium sp. Root157]
MDDGWFSQPVTVSVGIFGEMRHISNARQAVDLLSTHWPVEGSAKHRDARRACLDALRGARPVKAAREIFVEAAREAHILIE